MLVAKQAEHINIITVRLEKVGFYTSLHMETSGGKSIRVSTLKGNRFQSAFLQHLYDSLLEASLKGAYLDSNTIVVLLEEQGFAGVLSSNFSMASKDGLSVYAVDKTVVKPYAQDTIVVQWSMERIDMKCTFHSVNRESLRYKVTIKEGYNYNVLYIGLDSGYNTVPTIAFIIPEEDVTGNALVALGCLIADLIEETVIKIAENVRGTKPIDLNQVAHVVRSNYPYISDHDVIEVE